MSDFILKTSNTFYLSTRIHRYATTGHYVTLSNLSKKGLRWPRICQLSRVFIRPSSWNTIQSSGYATDRIYFMSFIPISWMCFYRSKIASDLVTWKNLHKTRVLTARIVLFLRTQIIFKSFFIWKSQFMDTVPGGRVWRALGRRSRPKVRLARPPLATLYPLLLPLFYLNSFKYI